MPTEIQKIGMQIDADRRLVAAAGGVARYFGDAAGLTSDAVADLQSAVLGVCSQEIEKLAEPSQRLEVMLTRSPIAIEVAMIRQAARGSVNTNEQPTTIHGVDRIQHETQSGRAITRLTKFVSEEASGA